KGKERDSDYDFDNRQGEFSRSYAKLKDSTAQRASLGIGWHFLPHRIISLRPQVGYAWSETDFHAKKGYQAVSGPSVNYPSLGVPPVGSTLDGLDSRYKPTTYGPWVGFQVGLHPARWLDLKADVKYQWAKYTADANWNLRSDLQHPKSFRHSGDIQGWQVGGEAAWNITSHHAIIAGVEWSKKSLSGGKDKTYFANGNVSEIKLRRVNQESLSANLGYRFSF
ncbi:MAG: hypothetical protein LBG78_08620, partial [Azoarcus sp.]|nr:hypothetical protein [Azoarcus sp.]